MSADFNDRLGLFQDEIDTIVRGGRPKPRREKGIRWRAKVIDGKRYVPLEQVVELLEVNDVLPAVRRGLLKSLRGGQ